MARSLPDRLGSALAYSIGSVEYGLRRRLRRNVIDNLRLLTDGESEDLERVAKEVFKNFAENVRLILKIPSIDREDLLERVDASEADPVLERLEPGRAFIIVTAHLGPWEIGGMYLAARGYTVNTVALDHPSPSVTRFFDRRREIAGIRGHKLDGSFEALKAAIERGEVVVLLVDRAYRRTGIHFPFFGIQRELPISHLLLAARYRVPVLPGAFLYAPGGRFRGILRGPHYISDIMSKEEGMEDLQRKVLRDLEEIIRNHPDQYFEFRRLR